MAIKELYVDYIKNNFPDVEIVVGLEARGFLFSFMIASELGIGCVPVRKKGKLPGETLMIEYALDYGTVSWFLLEDKIRHWYRIFF